VSRCDCRQDTSDSGHGSGAHGPDEFYVIESAVKAVAGYDGAVRSFIDYLYELASVPLSSGATA
jgi:hypothetical protein